MIRAKFEVKAVEPMSDGFKVSLMAVYGGSPENDEFFKFTPAGDISLSVVSAKTAEGFVVGKQYYVDFSAVEA